MINDLKKSIPIVGSGFNRWLCADIKVDGQALTEHLVALVSWWGLLEKICRDQITCPSQDLIDQFKRGSTVFAWESLIYEVFQQDQAKTKATSRIEMKLLKKISKLLLDQQNILLDHIAKNDKSQSRMQSMIDYFTKNENNHIISLNFDTIIPSYLKYQKDELIFPTLFKTSSSESDGVKLKQILNSKKIRTPSTYFQIKKEIAVEKDIHKKTINIWYPHGHITHSDSMIIGFHRYIMSSHYVYQAFSEWKSHPEKIENQNSWIAQSIDQPLLLLGVGLSQEEVDIWEFLHLRARNQANAVCKVPVFRLTCDEEKPLDQAHWQSLSKGLNIYHLNLGKTWDEAWLQLFKILNQPQI